MSFLFLVSVVTIVSAQDWASWRGPEQNGISRETNLVDTFTFGEDGARENVLWESPIGGRAAPVVLNGRVYLNCRTSDNVNDPKEKIHAGEQVVCRDANNGEVLWRDTFNVFQTDIASSRVGWAPMVGDKETGFVYVHSVSGIFRCYKPNGEVVWEHSLHEKFGKLSGYGGRTQAPIIDEDRIIVGFLGANWGEHKGPAPKHFFYAFDKRTGEVEWVSAPGGAPKGTNQSIPVIAVIDGQRLLISGAGDGSVYAMQARTGKKVWGFQLSMAALNATPVVDGKYVYISHGEDNNESTAFGRMQCIDGSLTGDITESGDVWHIDGIKSGFTAPLVKDGVVYSTTDTGKIFAFDSKTGESLWEHSIGTVGKGSPVWADGKMYVMEVNGIIRILKASREGCEELAHVELKAADASTGTDEIYASPAIANGKIYLVTRDRTICLGKEGATPELGEVVSLPPENPTSDKVATVLLTPYDVTLRANETVEYTLKAYDSNGNFIKAMPAESITAGEGLQELTFDGNKLVAPALDHSVAGAISCQVGDITADGRIRLFDNDKVWKWDFEGYKPMQVPGEWVRAFAKLKPSKTPDEDNMALRVGNQDEVRGRPSHVVWFGPDDMTNYTIQADVYLTEVSRRLSSMGINNSRYNLIMKANNGTLEIVTWAAHLRLGALIDFEPEPDTWYTMKLVVTQGEGGSAHVQGKVWERSKVEPEEWTIEVTDPRGNKCGSPGLYIYQQAESFFDNIIVTQGGDE